MADATKNADDKFQVVHSAAGHFSNGAVATRAEIDAKGKAHGYSTDSLLAQQAIAPYTEPGPEDTAHADAMAEATKKMAALKEKKRQRDELAAAQAEVAAMEAELKGEPTGGEPSLEAGQQARSAAAAEAGQAGG